MMSNPTVSAKSNPLTRRTRFVCISDTHNCIIKLPKGDVLIHCGDLTNQGSITELQKQVQWLESADFELKIVIAGNHDMTLDEGFMSQHGSLLHNNTPQDPKACRALLTTSKSLTYLEHESRKFKLSSPKGPRTIFSVFGSPYSLAWGKWAFQYPPDAGGVAARRLWEQIPVDTDILVTHGPARTHCDRNKLGEAAGCEVLRQALWRIRPRLALCGHVHEARGVERVSWDLEVPGKERSRKGWEDPHKDSAKNALVDLTTKSGAPLDNDGGLSIASTDFKNETPQSLETTSVKERKETKATDGDINMDMGGLAPGRRETCVVNCAVQASSYPHRGARALNKPIVVDIDLPVWETEDDA
ncbi:Metallo-dependent phosphatase [Xylariaceae sp. FL0255]|nr:Metallo-dependent phosphatase [Xylariaceae sp. FL0255]